MSELNVDLLQRVMKQIITHPETHNQSVYNGCDYDARGNICRTAYCVAGWAVVLSDWSVDPRTYKWISPDGLRYEEFPEEAARDLLGITPDQAWNNDDLYGGLFCSERTLSQVVQIAKNLAADCGETLDLPAVTE